MAVAPAVSIRSPGVTEAERATSVPFSVTFPDAYSIVLPVSAISIAAGVSNIIAMLRIFVAKQLRILDWPPSLFSYPIRQKWAPSSVAATALNRRQPRIESPQLQVFRV